MTISRSRSQAQMVAEIGFMRYDAIEHFLSDGDYKADHEGDFVGAFGDYVKAWSLLVTATARKLAGSEILEGIAEFATKSGDAELQAKAAALIADHDEETSHQIHRIDEE